MATSEANPRQKLFSYSWEASSCPHYHHHCVDRCADRSVVSTPFLTLRAAATRLLSWIYFGPKFQMSSFFVALLPTSFVLAVLWIPSPIPRVFLHRKSEDFLHFMKDENENQHGVALTTVIPNLSRGGGGRWGEWPVATYGCSNKPQLKSS